MLSKMVNYMALPTIIMTIMVNAQTWHWGDQGQSCAEVCTAENLDCDNESRLAVDSFDKLNEIVTNLGKNCLKCDNGCKDGNPSGPVATTWQGETYYCLHNSGRGSASCDQVGTSGARMICACKPKDNNEPVVNPPLGDKITVSVSDSCNGNPQETKDIEVVWTDKCQPDPMNPSENALIIKCSDEVPGAVDVTVYDGPCGNDVIEDKLVLESGKCIKQGEGDDEVVYTYDQWVVDRCLNKDKQCCRTRSTGVTWADEVCRKETTEEDCMNNQVGKCGWGSDWDGNDISGCDDKPVEPVEPECCRTRSDGVEWADVLCRKEKTETDCQNNVEGKCGWGIDWNGNTISGCEEKPVEPSCCRTMSAGGAEWADKECRMNESENQCKADTAHKCGWGKDWQGTVIEGCVRPTAKPTTVVPEPIENVKCYSVGDPHFMYFDKTHADFQDRGEFTLYETDGLQVQVRHGPHLGAPHVTHVSTNNGFAIKGDQTCGNLFEIYAENGASMKVTRQNGQVDEYFGVANIMTGLTNYACPSISTNVPNAISDRGHNTRSPVAEFQLDHSEVRIQIESYGINVWVEVEGNHYLDTDTGICTKRTGGFDQIPCEKSLFTVYPPGDCPALERRQIKAKTIDECDADLKTEAEKICSRCPKVIKPEDCVLEVCNMEDIAFGEKMLEACDIGTKIAPKRDVHCWSTGDPHFTYFDGTRRDFQDRGEFTLYETTGVKIQTRQGARPDLPNLATISTNHAVAIAGDWTCNHKFEFFYDGPIMKVTKATGEVVEKTGNSDIFSYLNTLDCPNLAVRGDVSEFSLEEGNVRVRVLVAWYGINVWVDVKGPYYLDSDKGICTKREGAFDQLSCRKSLFTVYPEGHSCADLERIAIPPTPIVETCDQAIKDAVKDVCNTCPDVVSPEECVMEACAVGGALGSVAKGIKAAQDLVVACEGAKTIAPVPTPKPAPKRDVTCASLGDPHMRYFDGTGNDFQSRGEFVLYQNSEVVIQVRQGVHLTIPTTHWAYTRVSTNNAFAIQGTWTCGAKFEVYATQPQKNDRYFWRSNYSYHWIGQHY